MKIIKYTKKQESLWNNLLEKSKNGTFLINRSFMEYHQDRFNDHSLLIENNKGKIIALFPANVVQKTIYTHQGLTYGGLILSREIGLLEVIESFHTLLIYFYKNGIENIIYKCIPIFYHRSLSLEDQYVLFLLNASLYRIDTNAVLNLTVPYKFQKRRERGVKKAKENNIVIKEENSFIDFWNEILVPNLKQRYNLKPTHTINEISLLKQRFPNNVLQFNVYQESKIIAGTTLFCSYDTVHAQYIATNEAGKKTGALDLLFSFLIKIKFKGKKYFSFGNSNEHEGRYLNKGLNEWKESFGTTTIPSSFYSINTSAYINLQPFIN